MGSKMEDVRCKMADGRWMMWLCAALFTIHCSLFTACKQEDDTIVYKDSRRWVEKTVAVVAPLNDPIMKARLERTAEWMLSSLHNAQLHDTLCIDLKLEWYDEYGTDLKALAERLANRDDLMAVIGPFDSDNVNILAPYCQQTHKPLILPTATSETVIRRFAITSTGDGQQPFLWSLTETDVSLSEVMQSRHAATIQMDEDYAKYADYSGLFTPNTTYGQTFYEWAPFQATELGIGFRWNVRYTDSEMLYEKLRAFYDDIDDVWWYNEVMPAFVVIESLEQVAQIGRIRYQWWNVDIDDHITTLVEKNGFNLSQIKEALHGFQKLVSTWSPIYYVLANLTDEGIAALDLTGQVVCDQYEGFSPYADPMTGFEMSYEGRYGTKPTFAECKFYDALLLSAFAANYMEHHQEVDNLNDAIIAITTTDNFLSGYAWSETGMELYLAALEQGQLIGFKGASGPVQFDKDCYTAALNTTYVNWIIDGERVQHIGYYSRKGNAQTAKTLASWNWLVENAEEKFDQQYGGATAAITYPALTDQYAVLVQGSNGWMNYRHEADVLNIYQMLKAGGYDDDHIILVSSDDAANAAENSDRGAVRTDPNGKNLREGAVIDYKNADLTPADIVNILKGVKTDRTPVVLPADAGQNVLLFWSGHGRSKATSGIDEMAWRDEPAGNGMTADLLRQTLQQMATQQQFRQMLVCLEPCYSANMGKALEGIPGVLAICSAGAYEQSFADSWSNELGVWMCDRFSRNLVGHVLENPDGTYRDLYLYCAQHTLGSHVGIYNYTNFGNLYTTSPKDFFVKRK
ncbi:Peptidase C13 family protein [Xylanibacter ruminicola]|uniref:Peptidase C13 family protein n=1 Tax=Xylanibacter ruminicola TaxID=839 RepID=A0A1H4CKR8_XYLRU|nr:C13 family peptidase [Xylanibacter ruminicola]SEA61031.1 Peptidase C13 family protein [Xylanibacter ruminicola]